MPVCIYASTTLYYDVVSMTKRSVTTFRIDEDLMQGLRKVQERSGVLVSEQVRRAIRAWLEVKAAEEKTERKRAVTRKRS